MYKVIYNRYNMDSSSRPGYWEELSKAFPDARGARIFAKNLSQWVIVRNIRVLEL
jgi:hypothetical protein